MRRRFSLGRALAAAVLLSLPVVACTDDPPTASGEDLFPGGTLPSTFQVVVPAESFVRSLGSFSGYTGPRNVGYLLVANRFDGELESHALARLGALPATVTYTRDNAQRTDSIAAFVGGSLIARVDTAASTSTGVLELEVWEVGQEWDPGSVSWQLAVDTAGVRVPWAVPGGTPGELLARVGVQAGVRPPGDSIVIPLDSLALARIAREDFPGLLVTASGGAGRVQIGGLVLRPEARPRGATPDTVVSAADVATSPRTFVFTPDQPRSADAWEAGGIRSARTLFRMDLPATVPVCRQGVCTDRALREVTLNEVSLLLEPVPVPDGFRPLAPVPLALRRVAEPELGRRAPLGELVNEVVGISPAGGRPVFGGSVFVPGDSVVAIPITSFVSRQVSGDTTSVALALLSDPGPFLGNPAAISFGVGWFAPAPRLRIVYTVPERPRLP